jgi:hypothetical protein
MGCLRVLAFPASALSSAWRRLPFTNTEPRKAASWRTAAPTVSATSIWPSAPASIAP